MLAIFVLGFLTSFLGGTAAICSTEYQRAALEEQRRLAWEEWRRRQGGS